MNEELISGFDHSIPVSNPDLLYGWNEKGNLLDRMLSNTRMRTSFWVHGERRSGKTSLLLCLKARLEQDANNPIPVIVDFQRMSNFETAGSHAGYVYILATIGEKFYDLKENGEKIFDEQFIVCRDVDLFDYYDLQDRLSRDKCRHAFSEIERFLKKHKKTLVLIIDECERMEEIFKNRLKNFFCPFRSLQEHCSSDGGIFFILAGAKKLDYLMDDTGSPQFNLMAETISVPPLDMDSFSNLWNDCRKKCSPLALENLDCQETDIKKIYDLCGGRPGYAKLLGHHWSTRGKEADENPLEDWMKNIFSRHNEDVKSVLLDIAMDRPVQSSTITDKLCRLYLIEENDSDIGGFSIKGGLWRKFLLKKVQENCDVPEFCNAGELAERIVEKGKISHLLKMCVDNDNGEYDDWLEFKYTLDPTPEQLEDARKDKKEKGDFTWNVVKAILSMRNTRGGLILLGVDDEGNAVGLKKVETNDRHMNNSDFVKQIVEKISQKSISIGSGEKRTTVSLEKCDWNISDVCSQWIDFRHVSIDDKLVVAIIVRPVEDIEKNSQWVIEINSEKYEKEYMLARKKKVSTFKILKRETEKIENYFVNMRKLNSNDLENFWKRLSNI